jgi:branched-chain amino acid aminotransferase
MEQSFIYNGKIFPIGTPVLTASNRAFRFGDSLFETIRVNKGHLAFFELHLARLFQGMKALGLEVPTGFNHPFLEETILRLADTNGVNDYGRVRLTVFRKDSGFNDAVSIQPDWIIECSALPGYYQQLNEDGYTIDIDVSNTKGRGPLSNIKSGNYLVYILAAQRARELQVNECLVLNSDGRIADSSIFNLFLIRNRILYTPSLQESPVAGVMRSHLIRHFQQAGNPVQESPISIADLQEADEVFLTNALFGIRWVKSFRSFQYGNQMTSQIYYDLFQQNNHPVV